MNIIKYDLFDAVGKADALCITTNGTITKAGKCVMGCGCAKQAVVRWPGIDTILANKIKQNGNGVNELGKVSTTTILSFPVKPTSAIFNGANAVLYMAKRYAIGDIIPGWAVKADLSIIEKSARELVALTDLRNWSKIIIPSPGCGAGELSKSEVYSHIGSILDDRFYITSL